MKVSQQVLSRIVFLEFCDLLSTQTVWGEATQVFFLKLNCLLMLGGLVAM